MRCDRIAALAGINGGFFDPATFAPAGLMISHSRVISPFEQKGWQEGVIAVHQGQIEITDRDAFVLRPGILHALQSSPWLIRSGRVEASHKSDTGRAGRAFAATSSNQLCAIGVSSRATFQEVGDTLLSSPVSKHIQITKALALDGATSAGFWGNVNGLEISDQPRTTVRNFIGLVPAGEVGLVPSEVGSRHSSIVDGRYLTWAIRTCAVLVAISLLWFGYRTRQRRS
jgi:uncharacterized protein YigE (DUF2233 family)